MADDDLPVVRFAADQRQPASDDEPRCVICGRYGAYICDATDEDVCSIECRDVCVLRHQEALVLSQEQAKQRALAATLLRRRLGIRVTAGFSSDTSDSPSSAPLAAAAASPQIPAPMKSFVDCALPPQLLANMQQKGLATPSPVQMQVLPCVLERQNLLVIAPTGSGKTAAYLVPTLAQLVASRSSVALVLAPVRELALQIEDVAKALAQGIPRMKTALLIGGVPLPPQVHRLESGVQLIVATPGRFLDVFTAYDLAVAPSLLAAVTTCVIDEVDVMLSIGFHAQLTRLLALLAPRQSSESRALAHAPIQLLCFSATSSESVEALAQQLVADMAAPRESYWRIHVGVHDRAPRASAFSVNPHVAQDVVWVDEKAKKKALMAFLATKQTESTLVFVRSKAGADLLVDAITAQTQLAAASIHADKPQPARLAALEAFVAQDVRVLVSTTVLSRGMDLLHVQNVVVFDFPSTVADYVHLIGRTGRGVGTDSSGATGYALTLVNQDDHAVFQDLVALLRTAKVRVPREVYERLALDARRAAFKTSDCKVVDEAKRAFRIHDEVASTLRRGQPLADWREWTSRAESKTKKLRRS